MKFLNIFETYKAQKELEALANDLLKVVAKNSYDMAKALWILNRNEPKLRSVFYNLTGVTNALKQLDDYSKYDELSDFINNFVLEITPYRAKLSVNDETKAQYISQRKHNNNLFYGEIRIRYKDELVKSMIDKREEYLDNGWEYKWEEMYFAIYYAMYSSLLHELQHAYDDYRTNRKYLYTKASRKFHNDEKRKRLSNIEQHLLSKEEIDYLADKFKDYLNLPHEVDARFTQAIKKTSFYNVDWDSIEKEVDGVKKDGIKYSYEMIPFNNVLNSFRYTFDGFYALKPTLKRRVLKRLGKFYQAVKDDLKNLKTEDF